MQALNWVPQTLPAPTPTSSQRHPRLLWATGVQQTSCSTLPRCPALSPHLNSNPLRRTCPWTTTHRAARSQKAGSCPRVHWCALAALASNHLHLRCFGTRPCVCCLSAQTSSRAAPAASQRLFLWNSSLNGTLPTWSSLGSVQLYVLPGNQGLCGPVSGGCMSPYHCDPCGY